MPWPRAAVIAGPAQHGTDARDELVRIEGFVEVVVGALFESHRPLDALADLGQQQHRNPVLLLAQAAQHLPTVGSGHEHVEDAHIGFVTMDLVESEQSVAGGQHLETGALEERYDRSEDVGLIIGD